MLTVPPGQFKSNPARAGPSLLARHGDKMALPLLPADLEFQDGTELLNFLQAMKMKLAVTFAITAAAFMAGACQVLYGLQQGVARQSCLRLPDISDMRECLEKHQLSFDDYRKRREALLPPEEGAQHPEQKPFNPCSRPVASGGPACRE